MPDASGNKRKPQQTYVVTWVVRIFVNLGDFAMQLDDQIVLTVLGCSDATFVPDRDPRFFRRHTVIYERRKAFFGTGIDWGSDKVNPGLDDAGLHSG